MADEQFILRPAQHQPTHPTSQHHMIPSRLSRSSPRVPAPNSNRVGRVQKTGSKHSSPPNRSHPYAMSSSGLRRASPAAQRQYQDHSLFVQARPSSWHVSSPSTMDQFSYWQSPVYFTDGTSLTPYDDWSVPSTQSSVMARDTPGSDALIGFNYNPGETSLFTYSSENAADAIWQYDQAIQSTDLPTQFYPISDPSAVDVHLQEQSLINGNWLGCDDFVDPNVQATDMTANTTCDSTDHGPVICDEEDSKPDLVGVGLYDDIPQKKGLVASWTVTRPMPPSGKGLKLEEMWEPPEDADDSDVEDDNESEENMEFKGADANLHESTKLTSADAFYDHQVGIVDHDFAPLSELEFPEAMWPQSYHTKGFASEMMEYNYPIMYNTNQQFNSYQF